MKKLHFAIALLLMLCSLNCFSQSKKSNSKKSPPQSHTSVAAAKTKLCALCDGTHRCKTCKGEKIIKCPNHIMEKIYSQPCLDDCLVATEGDDSCYTDCLKGTDCNSCHNRYGSITCPDSNCFIGLCKACYEEYKKTKK